MGKCKNDECKNDECKNNECTKHAEEGRREGRREGLRSKWPALHCFDSTAEQRKER